MISFIVACVKLICSNNQIALFFFCRYGKRETAAFAAGRMPACFGATKRVLTEVMIFALYLYASTNAPF